MGAYLKKEVLKTWVKVGVLDDSALCKYVLWVPKYLSVC